MQIPVTAACAALCGLLILVLAFRVSLLRMRYRVAIGDGGHDELVRAIRVHANTIEFVPIFVLLSLCYELYAGANAVLIGLDGVFVAARIAFAVGYSLAPVHPLRRLGAGLSYLSLLLASGLLLAAVAGGGLLFLPGLARSAAEPPPLAELLTTRGPASEYPPCEPTVRNS